MKFIIPLKDNNREIDTAICRALLVLSFIAIFLYRNELNFIVNLLCGLVLLIAAMFTKYLFIQLQIKKVVLLSMAAVLVFIGTNAVTFPLILLIFGMLTNLLHKTPVITIDATGVQINKVLSNKTHSWKEFSNIILKDNLLTIDFENNNILQVEIADAAVEINEQEFNTFCKNCLHNFF